MMRNARKAQFNREGTPITATLIKIVRQTYYMTVKKEEESHSELSLLNHS
jgi:hypothetical protein